MIGQLTAAVLHAAFSSPTPSSQIVYIIGAIFLGGLLPTLVGAYRRWKRGPIEDDQVIASTLRDDITGMRDLLHEYRLEVELLKRQLEDYRKELGEVTRSLSRAQVHIEELERRLSEARTGRENLTAQVDRLQRERDDLEGERARLQSEAADLRARIVALEDFARKMHPPPNAGDSH